MRTFTSKKQVYHFEVKNGTLVTNARIDEDGNATLEKEESSD